MQTSLEPAEIQNWNWAILLLNAEQLNASMITTKCIGVGTGGCVPFTILGERAQPPNI